jgi:biotin-dependent carboxylase-like uncharacterized protein
MPRGLRVLQAGPGVTIQDGGRNSYLRYGVTPAGPMDWVAFRTSNLALGNDFNAAALEISIGGAELICESGPLLIGYCGGEFEFFREGARLPTAARILLDSGQKLNIKPRGSGAWTYLATGTGFTTEIVLGSRATHSRSGLGGIEGRMLREGDFLPVIEISKSITINESAIMAPWLRASPAPIRVIPGPQDDYFSDEAKHRFYESRFTLTAQSDRMAYRLKGPEVNHHRGYNIVSDGVALGAIQIAGDRQPLILMADRQPTGGYPKIGHVARADIGRLAQMRPGAEINFVQITVEEARSALLTLEDEIAKTLSHLEPLQAQFSSDHLLSHNLIGGFINSLKED